MKDAPQLLPAAIQAAVECRALNRLLVGKVAGTRPIRHPRQVIGTGGVATSHLGQRTLYRGKRVLRSHRLDDGAGAFDGLGIRVRPPLPRPLPLIVVADDVTQNLKTPGQGRLTADGIGAASDALFGHDSQRLLRDVFDVVAVHPARRDADELLPEAGEPFARSQSGVFSFHNQCLGGRFNLPLKQGWRRTPVLVLQLRLNHITPTRLLTTDRRTIALTASRLGSSLVAALVLIVIGSITPAQEAAEDTPLQSRAKAVLQLYSSAKTKEAQTEVRSQLLAMADTLEAAQEDKLASECLERAAIVCYRFGEYDDMGAIGERGLATARRSGDQKRVAALLNIKAIHVSITGDNEAAIPLQLELVKLRQELGDVRGEGISWHNLAYSYFALFRYPEGIDAISSALRLHREAGNTYGLAGSMGTLSNALHQVGQIKDALAMADSAVARSRAIGDPTALGATLHGRARILHYAGRLEDATNDYEEAHQILTASGNARVAAVNDINWADALISQGRCDDAAETVARGLATLDEANAPQERIWGDCIEARVAARCGDPEEASALLLANIEALEAARDSMSGEASQADAFRMAGGSYIDLAVLGISQGTMRAAWVTTEASTARGMRKALGIARARLEDLQKHLLEIDAVVLQYGYSTVDRNVAYVITASDVLAWPIEITPGFRADVESAMRLLSSGAGDEECTPVLQRIADVAVKPAAETLAASGSRLIILPGDLAGLPFEALPLPGTEQTIGDRFSVTYAQSATAYLHFQQRESANRQLLVFADPDLGDMEAAAPEIAMRNARMSLAPLPEARAEGKSVGRSGTVLIGSEATRDAFMNQSARAGVLHMAAHAVVDGTHPDLSGIVLAGDGGDLVSADDIRQIALAADLVSLSGCETAGGYRAMGEGAFGLTRAFLLAGARSVVSSWWEVEDGAARRFMELYYERLRHGADRDIALQEVRRQMKQEGYSHRDRTAFALTGATGQPVAALGYSQSRSFPTVVMGAAGVLVIVFVLLVIRRRAA